MYWLDRWDMTDSVAEIEDDIKQIIEHVIREHRQEVLQAWKLSYFFCRVVSDLSSLSLEEHMEEMQAFHAPAGELLEKLILPMETEMHREQLVEMLVNEYYLRGCSDLEKVCIYFYILSIKTIKETDLFIWADECLTQLLMKQIFALLPEECWQEFSEKASIFWYTRTDM